MELATSLPKISHSSSGADAAFFASWFRVDVADSSKGLSSDLLLFFVYIVLTVLILALLSLSVSAVS